MSSRLKRNLVLFKFLLQICDKNKSVIIVHVTSTIFYIVQMYSRAHTDTRIAVGILSHLGPSAILRISHKPSSPSLECRRELCSGPGIDVYGLYLVTRPVFLSSHQSILPIERRLHSSVAAVSSAMLVAVNVLEIVHLDPVEHEVLGDDLVPLSEPGRVPTLTQQTL